ncbi:MAG: hypothetical protein VX822_00620 [Candidatus Neomarinimicrobiota bacterium]|nr:hypothetical protein [Candidatus Neomarinimicrobiota bacterium]
MNSRLGECIQIFSKNMTAVPIASRGNTTVAMEARGVSVVSFSASLETSSAGKRK